MTEDEFDEKVAKEWPTLNRRVRRLVEKKRKQMKTIMEQRRQNTNYTTIEAQAGTPMKKGIVGKG
jgi:mRNA-degrading endonuclease RelE of RelBE toxin-antitoxin system